MSRHIRLRSRILVGVVAALFLSIPVATQQGQRPRLQVETINGHDAVAHEALVKFGRALRNDELTQLGARADGDVLEVGRAGTLHLRSRSIDAAALVQLLSGLTDVEYAEPNYIVHALEQPNDVSFPSLWGMLNTGQSVNGGFPGAPGADIHATSAWDASVGSTANVVGIVDTGIDYTHVDLAPNVWSAPSSFTVTLGGRRLTCPAGSHGFNAIAMTCDPMDDHDHGTHVSGTIGAVGNNGIGVAGVNWVARLMGLKFIDSSGSGTVADAVNAIEFAIQAKAAFGGANGGANVRVLSNSWGGTDFSQALLDEINSANSSDMLFVAAAGNSSMDNGLIPEYPASYTAPNVVAVAATTNVDSLAFFSNYGQTTVHLGAPGVDILSTIIGNKYGYLSGTSMATPHVSGAAALVLSRCALDTAALKAVVLGTVDQVPALATRTITGGRLDVNSAVRACVELPGAPSNLTALGGNGQVTLHWSAAPGSLSANVKRSLTSGGPYALVTSGITTTSYTDASVANGTTYYYVVSGVDTLGEGADSNEASATPAVPSDLTISAFSTPFTGGAGSTMSVTETTKNQGAGAAAPSTTRFYLSTNAVLDSSDILVGGEHDVPALQPGETSAVTVSLTIPANVQTGIWALFAVADADHATNDSQRSNNASWKSIVIGPDLTLSSVTVPSRAAAGASVAVSETTKNQGGGSAPASTTRFYFSARPTLDSTATPLTDVAVPALAAGSSAAATSTVTLPTGMAAGTYYLLAKADADGAVAESSELNNVTARAIQIGGDLIESALTAPTHASSGASITVTDTTKNQGSADVGPSVTRFYFSTKAVLDASATQLTPGRPVPALAAGSASSGSTALTLPSAAPGTYYLFAVANGDGTAPESQTTNNSIARTVAIGPDLMAQSLTMPNSAAAGTSLLVGDTVKNQGMDPAGASTTRFYLSATFVLGSNAIPLGSRSVPALAAGTSSVGSTPVTIPADIAPGYWVVLARADADGTVAESLETNNVAGRVIQVTAAP